MCILFIRRTFMSVATKIIVNDLIWCGVKLQFGGPKCTTVGGDSSECRQSSIIRCKQSALSPTTTTIFVDALAEEVAFLPFSLSIYPFRSLCTMRPSVERGRLFAFEFTSSVSSSPDGMHGQWKS